MATRRSRTFFSRVPRRIARDKKTTPHSKLAASQPGMAYTVILNGCSPILCAEEVDRETRQPESNPLRFTELDGFLRSCQRGHRSTGAGVLHPVARRPYIQQYIPAR